MKWRIEYKNYFKNIEYAAEFKNAEDVKTWISLHMFQCEWFRVIRIEKLKG